jgi:hypothetical protein
MPNGPIGGISTLVHLLVILVYQIALGIRRVLRALGMMQK